MGASLLARASGVSCALDARSQILAGGGEDRQRVWGPEFVLLLPADRRVRRITTVNLPRGQVTAALPHLWFGRNLRSIGRRLETILARSHKRFHRLPFLAPGTYRAHRPGRRQQSRARRADATR